MKTHARLSSTSLESRHQPTDRYLNDRLPLREADPSVQTETSPNSSGAVNAKSNGCLWDDDGDLQSYEDCRLPDVCIPSSCLEDFGSEYQEYNEREWQEGTRQDDSCEICE